MSKFYNEIAGKYDFIFPLSPAHKTFFSSELRGHTVLDVGAATGNLTDHLLSEGYEVTAIDLSERLIAKAAEKGITVQQLNMLAIDELSTFDNIVCIGNTLPHLDSKASVQLFLQKTYRQLTQGGKLVLQLVNFQKYFAQQQGDYLGNFPLIANDKVKFERYYYLNEEGKIRFKTILDDTIKNEELLQPIFADQLTQWLTQIGFQAINLYGNFKKDPFDKEKSMALIITADK
ncbi:bifunctional 2-polyprenyl-6-hydroxyphenol methylase/3-demethylubiquinol 3-O-methyltransferase UbiG [Capnocytophaga sp. oral taxon 338]|uniref:class I SAM-dependent methyltransferase n=1 Tax=Capnocytophaga sp. oral taxon 338 TaxID=710239 RepID=UPI000202E932|nr:class I SAM-dependent methyltransferase [Capnocytophaga sp. oral taxon 338]EGD33740.1 type 11 methyltransferase [Capnocytophaga sp. oral taxon 338 str. F0234]